MSSRPSIRRRLVQLFVAGALVVVAAGLAATFGFENLVSSRHAVVNRIDPANVLVAELQTAYLDEETGVRGFVLTREKLFLNPYMLGQAAVSTATSGLEKLLPRGSKSAVLLDAVEAQGQDWMHQFAQAAVSTTSSGSGRYSAAAAQAAGKALFDGLRSRLTRLQSELASERSDAVAALSAASDQLAIVLAAVGLVLIGAALIVWRSLHRLVADPLASVGADAQLVSGGDLGHEVRPAGPREIADLAGRIEAMRRRIVDEVATVEAARHDLRIANDNLKRSNEELEQFAYVASHDLQEPLRKVTSFCQLLADRYRGQLDDQADEYIDFAVDGARRMQALINDLLALARIGRSTDHFGPVPLRTAVEIALRNLSLAIDESGASITVDRDLPTVWGDRGLLATAIQNLISNGIKFGGDAPPSIHIGASPRGDQWVVSVEDAGIGIDPRYADRIFVVFQRLRVAEDSGGTGIGLAMAKKIIEFHGGRIWLDTDHHPGSRISFELPGASTGDGLAEAGGREPLTSDAGHAVEAP